jgi:hypothetical protein
MTSDVDEALRAVALRAPWNDATATERIGIEDIDEAYG